MRIGVPGEFHEDRWPRTGEDSESRVIPRTREAGGDVQTLWSEVMSECAPAHTGSGRSPSDTSYRVAKRSADRSLARRPCPQMPQWHPRVAKRSSDRPSARLPAPRHLRGWFCAMNTDLETSVSGKGSSYGSEHRERISSPCNSGINGKFCLRYRLHFIIFASECSEYIRGTRKRQEHLRANRRRTGNAIREGSGLCYRQN